MMTKFEQVSDILNGSDNPDLKEFCFYWCKGDEFATVNVLAGSKYATRVKRYAEKFPEKVKIVSDTKDAVIAAVVPSAIKIMIVEREMSDEQREAAAERLRNLRSADSESEEID